MLLQYNLSPIMPQSRYAADKIHVDQQNISQVGMAINVAQKLQQSSDTKQKSLKQGVSFRVQRSVYSILVWQINMIGVVLLNQDCGSINSKGCKCILQTSGYKKHVKVQKHLNQSNQGMYLFSQLITPYPVPPPSSPNLTFVHQQSTQENPSKNHQVGVLVSCRNPHEKTFKNAHRYAIGGIQ